MGTHANPIDGVTDELGLRLCSLLEIDPGQTTEIELSAEPGLGAVVRWSGVRRVSLEEVSRAINGTPIVSFDRGDVSYEQASTTCGATATGLGGVTLGPCDRWRGHDDGPGAEPHRAPDGTLWTDRDDGDDVSYEEARGGYVDGGVPDDAGPAGPEV